MKADELLQLTLAAVKSLTKQVEALTEDVRRMHRLHELQEERMRFNSLMLYVCAAKANHVPMEMLEQVLPDLHQMLDDIALREQDYNDTVSGPPPLS